MIIFHPQFMNMTVLFTENEKKNDILFKKECYMLLNERHKQKTKKKSLKINFKFINWKKINRFSYYVSKTLDKFCCFRRFINEFFSCPFFNFIFVCDWNHRFCIFVEYAMSLQDSIGMYSNTYSVKYSCSVDWNSYGKILCWYNRMTNAILYRIQHNWWHNELATIATWGNVYFWYLHKSVYNFNVMSL